MEETENIKETEKWKPHPTRKNIFIEKRSGLLYERLSGGWFNIIEQDNPVLQELESLTRITDTMPVKSNVKPLQYYSKTTPIESEE